MQFPDPLARWLLSQMPTVQFDTVPGIDPGILPNPIPGPSSEPEPDPEPLPPPEPGAPGIDPGYPPERCLPLYQLRQNGFSADSIVTIR